MHGQESNYLQIEVSNCLLSVTVLEQNGFQVVTNID